MTRSELINLLIRNHNYTSYLEIGVNTPAQPGWNWDNVNVPVKHGVDPNPDVHATYVMTSDEFFEKAVPQKYDCIFIDGLHLFEQVYKDIKNSLDHLNEGGTIVVHDCNPMQEKTQVREHTSGAWHGDVWKSILKLRMEEPDLTVFTINTDEGCGIIRRGSQELLKVEEGVDPYTFEYLRAHRDAVLGLISVGRFKVMEGVGSRWDRFIYALDKAFPAI